MLLPEASVFKGVLKDFTKLVWKHLKRGLFLIPYTPIFPLYRNQSVDFHCNQVPDFYVMGTLVFNELGWAAECKKRLCHGCFSWIFMMSYRNTYSVEPISDLGSLKKSENIWLSVSDVFREYRKETLAWNGLNKRRILFLAIINIPAGIYLLKVSNRNSRTMC